MTDLLDRSKPPIITKTTPLAIPSVDILNDRLHSKLFNVDRNILPFINFQLTLNWGSAYNDAPQVVYDLLNALIKTSVGQYSEMEFDTEIEKTGGWLYSHSGKKYTRFVMSSLVDKFDRLLELMGLIINETRFEESILEREKQRLKLYQLQASVDPDFQLTQLVNEINYPKDSPEYSTYLFSDEEYDSVTVEDLNRVFSLQFNKTNSFIVSAGMSEAISLSEKLLQYWPTFTSKPIPELNYPKKEINKAIYIFDRPDSTQTGIGMMSQIGRLSLKQEIATKNTISILGGSFDSRLNQTIREKMGASYGISSSLENPDSEAKIFTRTNVDTAQSGKVVAAILNEYHTLNQTITESELSKTVSRVIGSLPRLFETSDSIIGTITMLEKRKRDLTFLNELMETHLSLTVADCKEVGEKFLAETPVSICMVGNADEIELGLKAEAVSLPIYRVDLDGNIL